MTAGGSAGSTRSSRYSYAAALGMLGVAVLLVVATWYSAGATTQRIAANAESLQWANSVIGALSIARASNGQAVVFAVDERQGVATADATERAFKEAERNLTALEQFVDQAPSDGASLTDGLVAFSSDGRQLLDQLRHGEVAQAASFDASRMEQIYQSLTEAALLERARAQAEIDASQDVTSRTGAVISFLGMFLLPASALITYWWIVRRQLRERKIRMEAELQAANELNQAKDRFIAGLSHELRTPLTGIYGFSQVLGGLCESDPEKLELVKLISSESAELSRMVEDVLMAARADAGVIEFSIEEVDPAVDIQGVVQSFQNAGKQIDVDCGALVVRADRLRLRQIMRNLVANAVKHGGQHIRIDGQHKVDHVVLRVMDDGPGISAEMREKLFDRYSHDGKEALLAGSVGLGLAIARQLARGMGGDVVLDENAECTSFAVSLPSPVDLLPPDLLEIPIIEEATS